MNQETFDDTATAASRQLFLSFVPKPDNPQFKDIEGQIFGQLTVLGFAGFRGKASRWFCLCSCGNLKTISAWDLKRKDDKRRIRSCGCHKNKLASERATERNTTHGYYHSRIYSIYRGMLARCNNPASTGFSHYGGRGIKICDRWGKFENFLADMGEPPSDEYSLDRIDVNGNYEPANCRWATDKDQRSNKRNTRRLTYNGKTQTVLEWADEIGLNINTLHWRLSAGWSAEKALIGQTVLT